MKRVSMMMLICIKQQLSNIWSSVYQNVKQHWGWVEKSVAYKKIFLGDNFLEGNFQGRGQFSMGHFPGGDFFPGAIFARTTPGL